MRRAFAEGERVIISETPVDNSDKRYAGMVGTIDSYTHSNGEREVYRVMLDDDDYSRCFYGVDLLPYGELQALQQQLVQAEAEVVRLKEAIKIKERDASKLPIATVVTYKDAFGPAVATKQAENLWLNVFPTQSGNSNTEALNDQRVTNLLTNMVTAVVRKP